MALKIIQFNVKNTIGNILKRLLFIYKEGQQIRKLLEQLKQSDFSKNIFVLISGTLLGYMVNICTLPILSRIYLPWQMGEYDLIISSANIVLTVMSLGMLTAIMLPKEDKQAINICKLIAISTFFISTIALVIVLIGSSWFRLFSIKQNYYVACILLYFYIIAHNIQNVFFGYVNRKQLYRVLFWVPLLYAICNSGFSILFGMLGGGTLGYFCGTLLAYTANIFLMSRFINPLQGKTNLVELRHTLIKFKTFPLVQMPANIISSTSAQIPIQAMGRIFGSSVLGGYMMACKIMSVPVSLLAEPINKVYYKTASEKLNNGEMIGDFSFNLLKNNLKIALLPLIFLIILGEPFLVFFLGKNWTGTGIYLRLAGSYYLILFCSTCFSGAFALINKKEINIISACVRLFINIILFLLIAVYQLPLLPSLAIYFGIDMTIQLILLGVMYYFIGYPLKKYVVFIVKYIVLIYGISYIAISKF